MADNQARYELDRQKMKDIGRVLGFFNAYSELQVGIATYHTECDASRFCDPQTLGNPKQLKKSQDYLDPHTLYLREDDCNFLYTEGWNEGHTQGVHAHATGDLEFIGEIAHLAGHIAPFYAPYTTAENDARDCKVFGEARTHFITNWWQAGGDRRKRKGV